MTPTITIIYAFRNRDSLRVKLSLQSLQQQTTRGFDVVFVDYGSEDSYAEAVKEVVTTFEFASYHYVGHPGLLWNKSKALNYGIRQATGEYVFIADVDILFHPDTLQLFQKIANPKTAFLFHLSYLSKAVSESLKTTSRFFDLPAKHTGAVNGMVLTSKQSLFDIHGVDEFFHFYGSEDVDLFQRLENSGIVVEHRPELYFKHQWHPIYNTYNDAELSLIPRLFNIKRINQKHFFYHQSNHTVIPEGMEQWGRVYNKDDAKRLEQPDLNIKLPNTHAAVVHFLEVVLPATKGQIVHLEIRESTYYRSFKHRLKKVLKKQSEPYISIKEINDMILAQIVFRYHNYNYRYEVDHDYKGIKLILDQKPIP